MSQSIPETCDAAEHALLASVHRVDTWLSNQELARRIAHDVAVAELSAIVFELREFESISGSPRSLVEAVEVIESRVSDWEEV